MGATVIPEIYSHLYVIGKEGLELQMLINVLHSKLFLIKLIILSCLSLWCVSCFCIIDAILTRQGFEIAGARCSGFGLGFISGGLFVATWGDKYIVTRDVLLAGVSDNFVTKYKLLLLLVPILLCIFCFIFIRYFMH